MEPSYRAVGRSAPVTPFAAGECWLRIGDGFVFGEEAVRAASHRSAIDIYCQDIRHGASLNCPHGAVEAIAPMTGIGLPTEPAAAAALLHDAPANLPKRNLQLEPRVTPQRTGIGLVCSAAGPVYKVYLAEVTGHPEALERRVRLRYEPVSQLDSGGGELQLAAAAGAPEPSARRAIRAAVELGRRIPGQGYADSLAGSYEVLRERGQDLTLTTERHIVFDGVQPGTISLDGGGGVFAREDLGAETRVDVGSHGGGVGVGRDLAGTVKLEGYGYVHVGRDVLGVLDLRGYATAAILGDLRGTVRVRSYIDLYVRGRVFGKLDVRGSCWSTFYLQLFLSRADLEAMPGNFRSITLHLMQSDLPTGSHKNVGTWREVIVGDAVWQKLAR